jgi:hypothetical protein
MPKRFMGTFVGKRRAAATAPKALPMERYESQPPSTLHWYQLLESQKAGDAVYGAFYSPIERMDDGERHGFAGSEHPRVPG